MVQEWGDSQVRAMFFDTAASNTGIRSGDCGVIEARLGKNRLYLTIRQHVHEIVVRDMFKHCFGPSSGSDKQQQHQKKDDQHFKETRD